MSKWWRLVPIVAGAGVLASGVAVAASNSRTVDYKVVAPVTVQALGVDSIAPAVGQTVTAGAKLVAERTQTFDYVVLAVRDQAGRNFDFPGTSGWTLSTSQKTYTSSRAFGRAGTYTYWFAFRKAGKWANLSPTRTFVVGGSSAAKPTPSTATQPQAPTQPSSTTTSPATPTSPAPTVTPSRTATPSPSTTATSPAGTPKPLGAPGLWTLKFSDEFNGPIAWGTKWADSSSAEGDNGHGNLGNQQLEWNRAANCSVANGVVSLTAKPDSITSPSGTHYNWSSCLLSSSPSYAFRYGYIEIRAQLPGPRGFWPAFWTWQAAGNNRWTETDVFEFYSDNHSRLYLTQHSGAGGGITYGMPFDPTTGFHTYGADIAPNGTRFYVDGKLVGTVAGTSTGLTNIIVDNFVYSRIPPAPGTTASMKVDYVRAWQH